MICAWSLPLQLEKKAPKLLSGKQLYQVHVISGDGNRLLMLIGTIGSAPHENRCQVDKHVQHRNEAIYFRPDDEATYCEHLNVNLSDVEHTVAIFPSPDNIEFVPRQYRIRS